MRADDIFDAIGKAGEKYAADADFRQTGRKTPLLKIAAVAACFLLVITGIFFARRAGIGMNDPEIPQPPETDHGGIGGTAFCSVHAMSYHYFPVSLIKYIGEDDFNEWAREAEREPVTSGGCPYPEENLYECIKQFSIPREELEKIYLTHSVYRSCIWNMDLLYSDDMAELDAFYTELKANEEMIKEKRRSVIDLKTGIRERHKEEWEKALDDESFYSVRTIALTLGLTREELEHEMEYYNMRKDKGLAYDYDLSVIYNDDGTFRETGEVKPETEYDAEFFGLENFFNE